jgi:NTP pyrophosphatase (non-canonical NTP hydrolase)
MDSDYYQELASRTLIDNPDFSITDDQVMLAWNIIGLCGEAGEVAEHVKKGVFHQQGIDRQKLAKELGDCLWYIAAILTILKIPMSAVMAQNIEKLKVRYPDGYSAERSAFRGDGAES